MMAISPIKSVSIEDVWQLNQAARPQTPVQQTSVLQTSAVAAPGDIAKTGGANSSIVAAKAGKTAVADSATANAGNADAAAARKEAAEQQEQQLQQVMENINSTFDLLAVGVQFEIDPDSKDVVVKVIDRETGEVIRQIPSAAMVRIAKEFNKLKGLLVEQTA
jgi:flagellar protein FlaG